MAWRTPVLHNLYVSLIRHTQFSACSLCWWVVSGVLKMRETCGSNICGHEIFWNTVFGLSEGLHWTFTEPPAVCLQSKQVCGWCSKHGTTLHPAASEQIRDFCEDPLCRQLISQDLKWDNHIESMAKKAQQRLYFLRQLRKFNLPQELLKQFYSAITESVLCTSITVWFSSATKSDLRRLRRVVRTAERIIGTTLPSLQGLYSSRVSKRADKITLDPAHPAHSLFKLLPSGRRYRALSTRTARHRNSFFPQAIISWTLDIKRGTHNTIIQLFIHHTFLFFYFKFACQTSHIIVCIVYCFCYVVHCLFVYCSFVVCVVSCCCHSAVLWSLSHYKKILICVNIPGQ